MSNKRQNSKTNFNSSKIKIIRCSEESLDNIDAALLSAEKCLENIDTSLNYSKNSTFSISHTKKSMFDMDSRSNSCQGDNEMSKNENNSVKKIVVPPLFGNLSNSFDSDNVIEIDDDTNSSMPNDDSCSTSSVLKIVPKSTSAIKTNNGIKRSNMNVLSTGLHDKDIIAQLESNALDTAIITIPSISNEQFGASYNYITSDDRVKCFIIEGDIFEVDHADDAYNPSEIDQILDDEIIFGVRYYLIKWKKWSQGFNTWERFGALCKSQKLVYNYALKRNKDLDRVKTVNGIHLMLSRKIISNLFELFKTETGLSLPIVAPEEISGLFNSLDIGPKKTQILRKKCLRSYLNTIALGSFRQQQLIGLKQWEVDINVVVVTEGYKIKVENNIDLEGPPDLFVYVIKNIPQANINIPDDPPIGCSCKKNCFSSTDCCNEMSGYSAVYDINKNITVSPGYPVFECNNKCKCTTDCNNRVVQCGSKINVCIYKTSKCGWGIKTNDIIKKGQFVATYIGEIITVEESERRLENHSSIMEHMWNLDFDDPQNYKYIIDGTHYANYTYFINHSCNANLNVYAVWINCLDRNLPQLALFASRDILAGEQLTTNYFSRCNDDDLKNSGIKCQCGMKNCRGYYF